LPCGFPPYIRIHMQWSADIAILPRMSALKVPLYNRII